MVVAPSALRFPRRPTHLFDGDGDADGVDGALDQHSLLLVAADNDGSQ